jgi:hypothetical protein
LCAFSSALRFARHCHSNVHVTSEPRCVRTESLCRCRRVASRRTAQKRKEKELQARLDDDVIAETFLLDGDAKPAMATSEIRGHVAAVPLLRVADFEAFGDAVAARVASCKRAEDVMTLLRPVLTAALPLLDSLYLAEVSTLAKAAKKSGRVAKSTKVRARIVRRACESVAVLLCVSRCLRVVLLFTCTAPPFP